MKHAIPNQQAYEKMTPLRIQHIREAHWKRFGTNLTEVTENPTGVYNCHGYVFAARRTTLHSRDVRMILNDDRYAKRLTPGQVKPGDVVLYVGPDGDIEHSAIVLEPPSQQTAGMPRVVGKWGPFLEYAHFANLSAYDCSNLEYYRVEYP